MQVWYACYGSNLRRDRFLCYLQGGRPEGARRRYPGARDTTVPADDRPMTLPGSIVFGWDSPTWGGGIAFYDAEAEGATLARAYLVTDQQFADVAAQEMHREPGDDLDLAHVLEHSRHVVGPGRYESLLLVGELEGHPVLLQLARVLNLPSVERDELEGTPYRSWPSADQEHRTQAEWDALRGLYSDEQVAQFQRDDMYTGWRTAITDAGQWMYFVSGD